MSRDQAVSAEFHDALARLDACALRGIQVHGIVCGRERAGVRIQHDEVLGPAETRVQRGLQVVPLRGHCEFYERSCLGWMNKERQARDVSISGDFSLRYSVLGLIPSSRAA